MIALNPYRRYMIRIIGSDLRSVARFLSRFGDDVLGYDARKEGR